MPSAQGPAADGRTTAPDKPSTVPPESVSSLSRFNSAHSLISATSLNRESQDGQPPRPPTAKQPANTRVATDRVTFHSSAEVLNVDYTPLNRVDSESNPQQPVDSVSQGGGLKKQGLPSQASLQSQGSLKRQATGRGGSTVTFSTHNDQTHILDDMVDELERREREKKQRKAALPLRGLRLGPITIFYIPLLLTLVLLTVAVSFIIWAPDVNAYSFTIWEIFMFFAVTYPLIVLADIVIVVFVLLLERVFLRVQFVLYFLMGSRRTLMWFLWSVFELVAFIIFFSNNEDNATGNTLYAIFMRILICVMLFMVAMILRHVLEKLIGYTCHEEAYFKRMRKALRHEFFIMALSEPPKMHTNMGLSQRVLARISLPANHHDEHANQDAENTKEDDLDNVSLPHTNPNSHSTNMDEVRAALAQEAALLQEMPMPTSASAFSAEGKAAALRAAAATAAAMALMTPTATDDGGPTDTVTQTPALAITQTPVEMIAFGRPANAGAPVVCSPFLESPAPSSGIPPHLPSALQAALAAQTPAARTASGIPEESSTDILPSVNISGVSNSTAMPPPSPGMEPRGPLPPSEPGGRLPVAIPTPHTPATAPAMHGGTATSPPMVVPPRPPRADRPPRPPRSPPAPPVSAPPTSRPSSDAPPQSVVGGGGTLQRSGLWVSGSGDPTSMPSPSISPPTRGGGRWPLASRRLSSSAQGSGQLPPASTVEMPPQPSSARHRWRMAMTRRKGSRPTTPADVEEGQRPSSPGDDTRSFVSAANSLPTAERWTSMNSSEDGHLPPASSSGRRRKKEVKKPIHQLTTVMELHSALEATEETSSNNLSRVSASNASHKSMELAGTNVQVMEAISLMEKHIRKSRLSSPLTEQLRGVLPSGEDDQGGMRKGDGDAIEREGQQLAFYLFYHIKGGDAFRDHLVLQDLHAFLNPKDASKAFTMLGAKGPGDQLTLPVMCEAIVALVRERVALAAALKGSKTVVAQVGSVLGVIIHIVFVFLYLLVFGYSANQIWLAISGAILGFSFIFASYLSAIFTCTMFLLTVHPFEVGDVIILSGNYYEVQKILLQHTRLKDSNGAVLWYPNMKMVGEQLQNLTRSEPLWQSLKVLVDLDTDIERLLADCHHGLSSFLNDNKSEFSGVYNIVMSSIADPMKAEIKLVYELSHNGINLRRTANARSSIYQCLAKLLLNHKVRYSLPTLPLVDNLDAHGSVGGDTVAMVAGVGESPGPEGVGLGQVLVRRPVRTGRDTV